MNTMSIVDELEFEWDDGNIEHLARLGIIPDEVEELFEGQIVQPRGGTAAPDRFRILGRTAGGRYLAVVVQRRRRSLIRPFTGRDMTSNEREVYERQVKG